MACGSSGYTPFFNIRLLNGSTIRKGKYNEQKYKTQPRHTGRISPLPACRLPDGQTCLRQLAFCRCKEMGTFLNLINPTLCTKEDSCPHYAGSQPVRFAKGFTNFQKRMFPQQYAKFMTLLICHFGRNQYFKRRRGDILLPPDEQAIIQKALQKSGVESPLEFDQYIEATHWNP